MNPSRHALYCREIRAEERRRQFLDRLTACHGRERAIAIVEGRDPATNADIASWRALGVRA